ncbi:MAG: VWA domain-containing protein [Candidatus Omnitrophota bacterium]
MKRGSVIILSVALSLAAHVAFIASSPFIVLPGMRQVRDRTRRIFRLKEVREKPVDVEFLEVPEEAVPSIKMTRRISERERLAAKEMRLEERLAEDLPLEEKKKKLREELLEKPIPEPKKFDLEEILKAEVEKVKKEVTPEKRSLAERFLSEGPVGVPGEKAAREEDLLHRAEKAIYGKLVPEPGVGEPTRPGYFRPGRKELTALEGEAQVKGYVDIDRFIDVSLFTYVDPRIKEKYFNLMISVKKGDKLTVIPKEVIFMIDSSKSITEEKLTYIKSAVKDSLRELNPKDRFNVVAFRGDVIRFKESPVDVTGQGIRDASIFLKRLVAVGQTDVNSALLEVVSNNVTMYPSYVMLVTDGRPTTGVLDSRLIIQDITRRNNLERPIFCFGGGARVNKYLLDFISYQNRAWSRFAPASYNIEKDFVEFYRQIKDPLLLNVRYRFNKLDTGEIYPKFLSDFYRGKPFILYGRYDDEDVFSMQLLGEIRGQTKEFIYTGSLSKAESGSENIAKEWAFTKIYHLISRITMGIGNRYRLRREIDELSRKYGIVTPYDLKEED